MKYRTLICKQDHSTGETGFCFEDMPPIDYPTVAREGLLMAHDIIEHQRGLSKIGTIGDELLALGGLWYTRGQHGEIRRDNIGSAYSPTESIAGDVINMGRMYIADAYRLHIKVPRRLPTCDADESIREIIQASVKGLREEFSYCDGPVSGARGGKYLRMAERLMRKGYNMAKRRFEGRGMYFANNQFWAIAEALDPWISSPDFEGQRLRLAYGNGEASVCEVHEDYEG